MAVIFSLATTASSMGHLTNKGNVGSLRWEAGKVGNQLANKNDTLLKIHLCCNILPPMIPTVVTRFVFCFVFQRPMTVVKLFNMCPTFFPVTAGTTATAGIRR